VISLGLQDKRRVPPVSAIFQSCYVLKPKWVVSVIPPGGGWQNFGRNDGKNSTAVNERVQFFWKHRTRFPELSHFRELHGSGDDAELSVEVGLKNVGC